MDTEKYTYLGFFRSLYRKREQVLHFHASDIEEYNVWREHAAGEFKRLLGWNILEETEMSEKTDFNPRILSDGHKDGHRIVKMSIATLPGVRMPFYVLIPDKPGTDGLLRTMLCLPAHGSNKEVVAGIPENEAVRSKLDSTPLEAYGLEFCRRGYIAVCPDPSGFGERQEFMSAEDRSFADSTFNPLGSSCAKLNLTAESLGLTLAGLIAWDMRKLLDFLPEMKNTVSSINIDTDRIGCAGFSGGGLDTLWITALDERIRLAVISGYVHGYYNSILDTHLCACNFVPDLWKYADISDIASLIAPRPLYAENGIHDPLNGPCGISDPEGQMAKIRQAYSLFGAEDRLVHYTPEGTHAWHAGCYDFVDRNL
jgi:hypothetical protein